MSGAGPGREPLIPDPEPWLEVWRHATDQARRRTPEVRLDVSYGSGEGERLDLYLPTHRPRGLPFAAFVHGVAWREALRACAGFPARAVHHRGCAFVVIGCDRLPAVDLAGQLDQVRRAWRFLVDNAHELGLDRARGHLLGHGSGAHLAALTAFDPDSPPAASAVLLSGLYDLEALRRLAGPELALPRDAAIAALSPMRRISRHVPRLVVAWGERESAGLRQQSRDFASACKARGLDVLHGELEGRTHFGTTLELAERGSQVLETLRARGG